MAQPTNVVDLTTETFDDGIDQEGIVLVDFWASWCGPCKTFAPIYEEVAALNPDVTFAKLDTEAHYEPASKVGIQSIPTVMVFRDGYLIHVQVGGMPADALSEIVQSARDVDMAAVRAASEDELGS